MNTISVSAPCKIHLLGEHAVVYGKPALLAAVDMRCIVTITPRNSNVVELTSKNFNKTEKFSEEEIVKRTQKARANWETFIETNDISLLKTITQNQLDYAVIIIGETLSFYKKHVPSGIEIVIDSAIPVDVGLGSSASLAVALAQALSILLGEPTNREKINDIAYQAELKRHGLPSGADNTAVCFGGVVWYRREATDVKVIAQPVAMSIPDKIAKNFIVINTGTPTESTGEMVGLVRNLYKENKALLETFLTYQERLTRELVSVLRDGNQDELMRIFQEGERNLEHIGVVSDFSKSIIREIEKSGGAAKICGGGGKTKATGVLLAYHSKREVLEKVAKNLALDYFNVRLGAEGVRVEPV